MNVILLTCSSDRQAKTIALELLNRRLVVCTKRFPVSSAYYWKGGTEEDNEVLLIMESDESKFQEIETVVKSLHSYSQPVLIAFPVTQMAGGLKEWLDEGLK